MTDPILAMQKIIAQYQNDPKWSNAPLGGVKLLSNTHIGDIGQDFVRAWCNVLSLDWEGAQGR